MTQRHTFLFGAVLAVAGAAVAADHYRNGAGAGDASQPQNPVETEAPAAATAPRAASSQAGTENGIIEFAPCSANMDGLMVAPSPPQAAPKPGATPATKAAPAPKPAPATPQQDGIIEFAPCAAAF